MLNELRALYEGIIIDHNASPRNYGLLKDPTHTAEGFNPTCGDKIQVSLHLETNTIEAIRFETASCAICKASASLMTCSLEGKQISDFENLDVLLAEILAGKTIDETAIGEHSELKALAGVSMFPARIKCAQLPWKTLRSALNTESSPQSQTRLSNA